MRPTSHLLLAAAAALVLAGAGSVLFVGPPDLALSFPEPSPSAPVEVATVDAAAVNASLAEVAAAREPAASAVDAQLRAVVRIDPMVAALRSPSSIDTTLDEVPTIVALTAEADAADAGTRLDELDLAIANGLSAVDATAAQADAGSWQSEFLAAQRDVLEALARWSTASGAVDAVVDEHWALWSGTVDEAAVLDENRWRYRSPEEAAGTWEITISDRLGPLSVAAAALEPTIAARDEAAAAVTAADARAAEVFAARPDGA